MKGIDKILVVSIAVLCILVGALVGNMLSTDVVVEKNEYPVVVENVVYNDTEVKNAIADISNKVNEEDNFKDQMVALAQAELEKRDYKELSKNLANIYEREDIISVIIRDTDVTNIDIDEGNADVQLELKVYYEDKEGDKVKEYLTASYVIEDSEVIEETF